MEELSINYEKSKSSRIGYIIIFSYFAAYGLYNCVKEGLADNFNVLFYLALLCFLGGVILILKNTVWLPTPILIISNSNIASNTPGKKRFTLDWVNVSKVNIGPGYITFQLNGGQKQQKLDLLPLKYEDLLAVKAKVMELCEFKNIPYHND